MNWQQKYMNQPFKEGDKVRVTKTLGNYTTYQKGDILILNNKEGTDGEDILWSCLYLHGLIFESEFERL